MPDFLVTPDLIRPHIGGVEVLLPRVKHHPVDRRLLIQFRILHVLVQASSGVDGEDVQESRMVVEWVAVDIVRREFGC